MKKKLFIRFSATVLALLTALMMPLSVFADTEAEQLEKIFTAKNYCNNGMVALFDGIENAGFGVHDSESRNWVNLYFGKERAAAISNYFNGCWEDNCLNFDGKLFAKFRTVIPMTFSVEIVCDVSPVSNAKASMIFGSDNSAFNISYSNWKNLTVSYPGQKGTSPVIPDYDGSSVYAKCDRNQLTLGYSDGTVVNENEYSAESTDFPDTWSIGGYDADTSIKGKIYCIRIYDRILTEEEITANSIVDQARFFTKNEDYNRKIMKHTLLQDKDAFDTTEQIEITDTVITDGLILKDGKTYVFKNDCTITSTDSKLKIFSLMNSSAAYVEGHAKAYIKIEDGVTVTFKGKDGNGAAGGGAGIYVSDTSTLIIKGKGTLVAKGGNGGEGTDGKDATSSVFWKEARNGAGVICAGDGGDGGNGGGGAGAGIGGFGGNGGTGGTGGRYTGTMRYNDRSVVPTDPGESNCIGTAGTNGKNGSDGIDCGKVLIMNGVTVKAEAGKASSSQRQSGKNGNIKNDAGSGFKNNYSAGSAGGGGAGMNGLAPVYGIGGGGAGGAGGGGSAGGTCSQSSDNKYIKGGRGGQGGAANAGAKGAEGGKNGGSSGQNGRSGNSGTVYISPDTTVSGRPCYYYSADLYQTGGDIWVSGTSELELSTLGDSPWAANRITTASGSDAVTSVKATDNRYLAAIKLAVALQEAKDHGGLKGYSVIKPSEESGCIQTDGMGGAYKVESGKGGYNWYKEIVDTCGGYTFLVAEGMLDYFKIWFDKSISDNTDYRDPYHLVEKVFTELKNEVGNYVPLTDDMKELLRVLVYCEHYSEGNGRGEKYTRKHQTSGSYYKKSNALECIDLTYTIVTEDRTPRSVTWTYDTNREKGESEGIFYNHYYYRFNSDLIVYHDNKIGITDQNWMKYLDNDMAISEVNIPGTHDSGTYKVIFGTECLAQCQDLNFKQQMEIGIRMFDIRLSAFDNSEDYTNDYNRLYLNHGSITCYDNNGDVSTLEKVFEDGRTFLKKNNTEFLVYTYQYESGSEDDFDNTISAILKDLGSKDDVIVLKNGDTIPTVREARGKIIFMSTSDVCKYEDNYEVSAADKIGFLKEVFSKVVPQDITGTKQVIRYSGKLNNMEEANPRLVYTSTYDKETFFDSAILLVSPTARVLFEALELTDINMEDLVKYIITGFLGYLFLPFAVSIALIIGRNFPGSPYVVANDVNDYLSKTEFEYGKRYGWIPMNFPNQVLSRKIYLSNGINWDNIYADYSSNMKDIRVASVITEGSVPFIVISSVIFAGAVVILIITSKKKKANKGKD